MGRGRSIDISGQSFGRLTVISDAPVGKDGWGGLLWRCRCECGGEVEAQSNNLRSGKTKSCGCIDREKLAAMQAKFRALRGTRQGKLTYLAREPERRTRSDDRGSWHLWVRCDCGEERAMSTSRLLSPTRPAKSCGCARVGKCNYAPAIATKTDLPGLRRWLRRLGRPAHYHEIDAAGFGNAIFDKTVRIHLRYESRRGWSLIDSAA